MNIINKFTLKTVAACLGIALITSCNGNAHKEDESPKEQAEDMNEQKFDAQGEKDADRLTKAHMMNLFEIMSAENAMTKATNAEVKKVAEMIKTAHTKMDKDLMDLAAKKNITLPGDLTDDEKRKMDKQNEKTGMDFDKEFIQQMKNGHEDAIDMFEKASDKAEDADIKQFAANSIPEVRSHLTMIETCWNNIKDMKDNDHKDHMDKDHKDHHTTK
jgi:putative membrane protein